MKRKIVLLVLSILIMMFTGCGKETVNTDNEVSEKSDVKSDAGYSFTFHDIKILMNDKVDDIIKQLGESNNYFESEACAFQGIEKVYGYNGFELYTYPLDDVDYVLSISFLDDTVSTEEGISIGSSKDDLISNYGDPHNEDGNILRYIKGKSELSFIVEDGIVESIEYMAITD